MSYPTEPKKYTILERFVTVLNGIVAGDDYFFTPGDVQGKQTHWKERLADLSYAVYLQGSEQAPVHLAGHVVEESLTVVVAGYIKTGDYDLEKMIACCLRDVRQAVFTDQSSGASGSLGAGLCLSMALGPWTREVGQGTTEFMGHFEQQFMITTSGDIKDL